MTNLFKVTYIYKQNQKKIKTERKKIKLEKLIRQEHGTKQNYHNSNASFPGFDAPKNIRLVSRFYGKSVEKYFLQFEKISENLNWPSTFWPTLLQSVLTDRPTELYSSLSTEDTQQIIIRSKLLY